MGDGEIFGGEGEGRGGAAGWGGREIFRGGAKGV